MGTRVPEYMGAMYQSVHGTGFHQGQLVAVQVVPPLVVHREPNIHACLDVATMYKPLLV